MAEIRRVAKAQTSGLAHSLRGDVLNEEPTDTRKSRLSTDRYSESFCTVDYVSREHKIRDIECPPINIFLEFTCVHGRITGEEALLPLIRPNREWGGGEDKEMYGYQRSVLEPSFNMLDSPMKRTIWWLL